MAPEVPDGQHDRCLQKTDVSRIEFAKFIYYRGVDLYIKKRIQT